MTVRVKFREGDWFAVPLRDSGYAVGIVARSSRSSILAGYFFGPRREAVPAGIEELGDLRPEDAVMVTRFTYNGLRDGSWPIIGRDGEWGRALWPMPVFCRYEELTGRSFRAIYPDDNPSERPREELVDPGIGEHLPSNDLWGSGAVELRLTRMLA